MASGSSAHPLYGGPSYDYSYQQELDPTEQQYFQELALGESQQLPHLGQSRYQDSYSQSYMQRYHHNRTSTASGEREREREREREKHGRVPNCVLFLSQGFGVIPEDSELVLQDDTTGGASQRKADTALESWKMGSSLMESQGGSGMLTSVDGSSVDLKDFLSKRGGNCLSVCLSVRPSVCLSEHLQCSL